MSAAQKRALAWLMGATAGIHKCIDRNFDDASWKTDALDALEGLNAALNKGIES